MLRSTDRYLLWGCVFVMGNGESAVSHNHVRIQVIYHRRRPTKAKRTEPTMTEQPASQPPHRRILYATQTGRARACARRAARLLQTPQVSSFDDDAWFQSILSHQKTTPALLILIVSTTGDGEQTDSMRNTWQQLLRRSLPSHLFQDVSVVLFGIGDRAYGEQFCAAARKLTVRLQQLGAVLACKPVFGDSGNGNSFWQEFDGWIETLQKEWGVDPAMNGNANLSWEPKYTVEVVGENGTAHHSSSGDDDLYGSFRTSRAPRTTKHSIPAVATVVQNKRLTPEENWEYETRHIQLQLPSKASYAAGDVATILPRNSPARVNAFLRVLPEALQKLADTPLKVHASTSVIETTWPCHCTLRGWLTHCADIEVLPEREDLRLLAALCSSSHPHGLDQQKRLLHCSESDGTALYTDYVLREKRCWIDVLYDFDSLRHGDSSLTLPFLWTLLTPIRPREFSIASAPTDNDDDNQNMLELCVGVVRGTTRLQRQYRGFCSNFLAQATPHTTQVHLWIRPGLFDATVPGPLLCVGAGTGIAPLRSILRARRQHDAQDSLVFGCRKRDADCYYADEWESLQVAFRLACSREGDVQGTYVQHIVSTKELADHTGAIFIAGNPRMARAIQASLLLGLQKRYKCSETDARQRLRKLQRDGRFVVEAWS